MKKWLIWPACLLAVIFSGVQIYNVNHSHLLDYMPNKIIYEAGTRVPMSNGFTNLGYAELSGYSVTVTNRRLVPMNEYLAEYGWTIDALDQVGLNQDYRYVYIVSAVFAYDGDGDPLNGVIDLSCMKLVGSDYYIDFSTGLNKLDGVNPKLDGYFSFSIGSGKPFEVEMPFPIDTESVWGVTSRYLENSNPKLLLSYYPDEIYLELE